MKEFKGIQKDILMAENKNQLVSAGAGSGKTTVMIEKIANLLLQGKAKIENILVVTFTVLAGQEMKDRLLAKLQEELLVVDDLNKEFIIDLIERLDTASIDTIDGFASKTIKKYFYELNISPNIEIINDATKDYYLTRAMNKTFDEFDKDEIAVLLDLFSGNRRNLDSIKELVMFAFKNVTGLEDYETFLMETIQEYHDCVKSEKILNDYMCGLAQIAIKKIIAEYSLCTKSVQDKLQLLVAKLQSLNEKISFKANLKILNTLEKPKFSPYEYKQNENLKELLKETNGIFEFNKNLIKNQIDENYEEKNEKIINYLTIFINLLKKFIINYKKIKEKNNLIDFNDLNRLMIELLKNEKIKDELQKKYTHIFIDEYQDVNSLQGKLIKELRGENTAIFMVGDVKQSIYGFRGSSPELFLNEYDRMKRDKEAENVFDMNINFRSNPKILKFINEIFSVLMTKELADIDYSKDAMIEPQREDIVDDKVKILVVKDDKEEVFDKGIYSVKKDYLQGGEIRQDKEALLVAKTITELVGQEFYDANQKRNRTLTYSDIAILTHSDKDDASVALVDVLKNFAIPVNQNNKLDIKSSEIIKLILSICKCVLNMADDVDMLSAMCALTDFDIDDVVELRDKNLSFSENIKKYLEKHEKSRENIVNLEKNYNKNQILFKIYDYFNKIEKIRKASFSLSNKELIGFILNEMRLKYYILQKPFGEKQLQIVEEFMQKISPLEDSLGLCEFIEIVESNVDESGDFMSTDKEDSVTLQTIHKSKGLEYPVVILFNSSKKFAHLNEHSQINFNVDVGFGVDFFDAVNRTKSNSLTKFAIDVKNRLKGYKEELRLLYVALTRAKNKLIITGKVPNFDFKEIKKTSYMNLFLSCYENQLNGEKIEKENFIIEFLDDVDIDNIDINENVNSIACYGKDFVYPYADKFVIPIKNTVTGINKLANENLGFKITEIASRVKQYDIEDRAKTGVNYHSALEVLDFSKPYMKNSDFEDVDYKKIKLAHEKLSPLINGAINIKKEAQFMMYLPYNQIVKSNIQDRVLIQGVVDLIIEYENSITLVDYKFSVLPAGILKEKYKEQLNLYKMAIEKAFKKKVEHMFIYSINSGELV